MLNLAWFVLFSTVPEVNLSSVLDKTHFLFFLHHWPTFPLANIFLRRQGLILFSRAQETSGIWDICWAEVCGAVQVPMHRELHQRLPWHLQCFVNIQIHCDWHRTLWLSTIPQYNPALSVWGCMCGCQSWKVSQNTSLNYETRILTDSTIFLSKWSWLLNSFHELKWMHSFFWPYLVSLYGLNIINTLILS